MLFQETKYKTSWETPPEKKKKKHVWDTTLPSPYCNLKETVYLLNKKDDTPYCLNPRNGRTPFKA